MKPATSLSRQYRDAFLILLGVLLSSLASLTFWGAMAMQDEPVRAESRNDCVGKIVLDRNSHWETYGEIPRDLILNEICPSIFGPNSISDLLPKPDVEKKHLEGVQ